MRVKSKLTKIMATAFLALSMAAGSATVTAVQADAEGRAYEPYAVSFGNSGSKREGYITDCYLSTVHYGPAGDTTWHYFSDSYCKEGVGYQLRHRSDLKVEPTFAGKPDAAGGGISDPFILIGGLKAKLVPNTEYSNVGNGGLVKLHIEGKYELNLGRNYCNDEKSLMYYYNQGNFGTPPDKWNPGAPGSSNTNPNIPTNKYDGLDLGDNKIHYWYIPRNYYIQLLVNGEIVKVPLEIPNNNKEILKKDAILQRPEELFAGEFSQDIYLPGKNVLGVTAKGQETLKKEWTSQMQAGDLKSLVIDWVLSTNTRCGMNVPLDGAELDCSTHYIEDVGIVDSYADSSNANNLVYKFGFITNAINKGQEGTYSFDLDYDVDGITKTQKGITVTFVSGERQKTTASVSVPKNATRFVITNVTKPGNGVDKYRYYAKDFRLLLGQAGYSDGVTKVISSNESTITVNVKRSYKLNYDLLRGVFDKEYPNIAASATQEMKDGSFLAEYEYTVKNPTTGLIEKRYKTKRILLKDKSGEIDLSLDFPGDALQITLKDIVSPKPYNFTTDIYKVLYRATDGLPKPTEFSADVAGSTKIVSSLGCRELRLRVDYASPNTHKYKMLIQYMVDGVTSTVSNTNLTFTAKEGYHSYGIGDKTVELGLSNQPIQSIPENVSYIRLVRITDTDTTTHYKYDQYLYCAHSYDSDCDDRCNWCGEYREVSEHIYSDDCDATCNVPGCGYTRDAHHEYEPKCSDTCKICHKKTRNVSELDCVKVPVLESEPTCTEDGKYSIQCVNCKKKYEENTLEKLGHKYETIIDKEPTATEAGSKHDECTRCHDKKAAVVIPALAGNTPGGNDQPGTTPGGNDQPGTTPGGNDQPGTTPGGNDQPGNTPGGNDQPGNTPGGNDANNTTPNAGDDANNTTPNGGDDINNTNPNGGDGSVDDIVKGEDGTYLGAGANEAAVDSVILATKSDKDPAGSVFGKLQLKAKKTTKNSITLSWKKVAGAKYVVYGNKCGRKYKKLSTTNKPTFTAKKLKKGTYYKYIVVAIKDGKVVSSSKSVHVATKGGKFGNYKKVQANVKKVTLKKNKSFKLKAKQIAESKKLKVKKHRTLKYESSDKSVVTVSSKGKIKAVGKGTAYVYAYSQNGVFAKVKVTVK